MDVAERLQALEERDLLHDEEDRNIGNALRNGGNALRERTPE
jgi:hypothetical protein